MTTIYCHPDNLQKLKAAVSRGEFNQRRQSIFSDEIKVVASPHVDKHKPTGRYLMPVGPPLEPKDVRIRTRFIDYGPEDVDYLVYAGVIKPEVEAYYYVVDEPAFRMHTTLR